MGVLSAFALLWSAMETWSWSRRSGKSGIDPYTLSKLIMNTCGNLANVFLAVVFFTSIYWFIFFKQQNYIHAILPTKGKKKKSPFKNITSLLKIYFYTFHEIFDRIMNIGR